MNKQAELEEIYNAAFNDELEKIAIGLGPGGVFEPKKMKKTASVLTKGVLGDKNTRNKLKTRYRTGMKKFYRHLHDTV